MPRGQQTVALLETDNYGGINTAIQFSQIPKEQSPSMQNVYMDKIGEISKRPGSIPVTNTPLDSPIQYIVPYYFENSIKTGVAPTLTVVTDATSTLPVKTYYVKYTYLTSEGETTPSTHTSKYVSTAGKALQVTIPALPTNAVSANIYIGLSSTNVTLQANITTTTYTQNQSLVTGQKPPTQNMSGFKKCLCTSGDTLYSINNGSLLAATMTNKLKTADIYSVSFTDANNQSVLFITDGGNVKRLQTNEVKEITAAANDPSPAPPNDLTNINTKNQVYCWVYSSHIFISDGKDTVWYSKRFSYDYWPSVQFERWVRDNDHITGPGISFNNVCLIPMRRGWGYLTGKTVDDFDGNQFINTVYGCIAPRSIQKITYPTGQQTIAYLSDNGVHEIYDTGAIDTGSRQYATRSLMSDKVDFNALGLTDDEKKSATSYFDKDLQLYFLFFKQGENSWTYAYDVRNGEWYPWFNLDVLSMFRYNSILYFSGNDGHLKKLDQNLYSDWDDLNKTTGTPVHFKRYSPALSLEFSGYQSYWDYYLVEAKQWNVPSTLDITVVFSESTIDLKDALVNEVFTWGVSTWGKSKWTNVDYTDLVNEPSELIFHNKAKYCQVLWENNRDEPVTIYKDKWKGRISGR